LDTYKYHKDLDKNTENNKKVIIDIKPHEHQAIKVAERKLQVYSDCIKENVEAVSL
jgi:hypothetical protein